MLVIPTRTLTCADGEFEADRFPKILRQEAWLSGSHDAVG